MFSVLADGMTYSFGVFYGEFLTFFHEGESKTAWIVSILVGVTLSSGKFITNQITEREMRPLRIFYKEPLSFAIITTNSFLSMSIHL